MNQPAGMVTMTTTVMMMMMMGSMWMGGGVGAQSQNWKHGRDATVCSDQPNSPGPGLPDLPQSYSLRVEANILRQHKTITLQEYYDYNDNIAAVRQVDSGTQQLYFYLYNSNQYLAVGPDGSGGNFCMEQKLSDSANQDMFGLKTVNSTMDRIFSVKGALHFGDGINEKYMGNETVRGIPCNKWKSCQYWDQLDATSTVFWYFSDDKQWSSISGLQAPVRCHIKGVRWVNQSYSYPYEHIYEFYDFQPDVLGTDRHFEVPANTYCFSEHNTKPLPTLPPAYSYDVENLDINANTISFIREEYDSKTNLLRFDYREAPDASGPYGANYISQYHDFNSGVAYIIDVMRANCTTTVIPQSGFDDITYNNNTDVKLKNPNEFLDLNHKYIYQGVRTTRGIKCDSWAAVRFDYPDPKINNPATTWTWYFATEDWMRGMAFRNNFVMPIMLEIFGDSPKGPIHKQLSFYEFNIDEPDFLTWDISPCYGPSQSANFAFLVQGSYSDVVNGDLTKFKYYVLASLQPVLGDAPLRVTRLDVQEAGNNTLVTFDLLDKAPLKGDVAQINHEPDLARAISMLNDSVNTGQFKILQQTSTTAKLSSLTVLPAGPEYQLHFSSSSSSRQKRSAFTAPAPASSGFSGGAMGGMAAGMVVLGALVGFAVMFLIYKLRGGSFGGGDVPMKKFDNE